MPSTIPVIPEKWTACSGFGGRHPSDSVDDMLRIHWPPWTGLRTPILLEGPDQTLFVLAPPNGNDQKDHYVDWKREDMFKKVQERKAVQGFSFPGGGKGNEVAMTILPDVEAYWHLFGIQDPNAASEVTQKDPRFYMSKIIYEYNKMYQEEINSFLNDGKPIRVLIPEQQSGTIPQPLSNY